MRGKAIKCHSTSYAIREHLGQYGLFVDSVLRATSTSPLALADYAFAKGAFEVEHGYNLSKAKGAVRQSKVIELD